MLTQAQLLELQRWNTPTIYNGWERYTSHDPARDGFNLEETRDFMPHMGPMAGYAATVVIQPSRAISDIREKLRLWSEYRRFIAAQSKPIIVVVQDLDKPECFGSFWGEVNSGVHRALGCVGTITDGGVRDLDEMMAVGFKALARRLCVGHAHSCPLEWGGEVEVFGRKVRSGQLIHADKHGFLAIPEGEEKGLLEAARFMDSNECQTLISPTRYPTGKRIEEMLGEIDSAFEHFARNVNERFE